MRCWQVGFLYLHLVAKLSYRRYPKTAANPGPKIIVSTSTWLVHDSIAGVHAERKIVPVWGICSHHIALVVYREHRRAIAASLVQWLWLHISRALDLSYSSQLTSTSLTILCSSQRQARTLRASWFTKKTYLAKTYHCRR